MLSIKQPKLAAAAVHLGQLPINAQARRLLAVRLPVLRTAAHCTTNVRATRWVVLRCFVLVACVHASVSHEDLLDHGSENEGQTRTGITLKQTTVSVDVCARLLEPRAKQVSDALFLRQHDSYGVVDLCHTSACAAIVIALNEHV